MHAFHLQADMLTLAGAFYPTGHVFAMFPHEADVRDVAHRIEQAALSRKPLMMLRPRDILDELVHTVGHADIPLPSVGTEAATVRRYAELAAQDHWGLMVYAPDAKSTQAVMDIVRTAPVSLAEKYRQLVIEDLA